MPAHPTPTDVHVARRRIADRVVRTPLRRSEALSKVVGVPVHLKLENRQETGSFKLRGAANAVLSLGDVERSRGVVAVSSGNHGRAVAKVCADLGIDAVICLSSRVPPIKVDAIADLGATVVVAGPDQDDADAEARRLVSEEGRTFVHPFDDPAVIAGQGTIALEILEDLPEVTRVLVPLSGGGLLSGIGVGLRSCGRAIGITGVSQERGPAMYESLRAGRLTDVIEEDTLADALAGSLGPSNDHSFDLCSRLVDEIVLVSEDEIAAAMAFLHDVEGERVEGGGAVGVAAVLADKVEVEGSIVIVVSGGNVAPEKLAEIVGSRS